jgi:hypothetical protein
MPVLPDTVTGGGGGLSPLECRYVAHKFVHPTGCHKVPATCSGGLHINRMPPACTIKISINIFHVTFSFNLERLPVVSESETTGYVFN